jgi:UDP-N-acetylglucosamine--N-acetylmuramyl-(pentapeptide) pyrophosphoryl-undecaprenol N-acetylglucosamine transferase
VLILGGSLGAKAINGVMSELADNLEDKNIKFWHQTGPLHYAEVEKDYAGRGLDNVRLTAFIEDIAAAYRWADLVICRAGALTVSELTVMSKPAVLIPLPEAIDDHQTHNAQWMEGAGAAVLVTQVDFSVSRMTKLLSDYSTHPELLKSMARKSGQIGCSDATQLAVAICEEVYCE